MYMRFGPDRVQGYRLCRRRFRSGSYSIACGDEGDGQGRKTKSTGEILDTLHVHSLNKELQRFHASGVEANTIRRAGR
jgi:hypothetical protein